MYFYNWERKSKCFKIFEKAIKSKPNYPDAHINLGIAFKSLKKMNKH